jgi:hypothetical protein
MRKIFFGLGVFVAACGGSEGGHVTQPGHSVYTTAVQRLVVENHGGGFIAPPPPDAACDPQPSKYTLDVGTHALAWQFCAAKVSGTGTTYEPASGSRALTDGEWTSLQPALQALVVDDGKTCGADKPTLTLTVTTASGDLEYGDGFYGCEIHDKPLIASDGLSGALQAFHDLAHP